MSDASSNWSLEFQYMADDELQKRVFQMLEGGLKRTDEANRRNVERLASARLEEIVAAIAGMKRAEAGTRYGWALMALGFFLVVVAVYMNIDGKGLHSHVLLLVSVIPLIAGGWYIDRANKASRKYASELERLRAVGEIDRM
jgi:hypothetical protein